MRSQGKAWLGPLHWRVRGILTESPCHRPNRNDGDPSPRLKFMVSWNPHQSFIQGQIMKWSRCLNCKLSCKIKLYELQQVCLGVEETMDLSTSSWAGVSWIWPPNTKITLSLNEKNPSLWYRKVMQAWVHYVGLRVVSWLNPYISNPKESMVH